MPIYLKTLDEFELLEVARRGLVAGTNGDLRGALEALQEIEAAAMLAWREAAWAEGEPPPLPSRSKEPS